MKESGQGKIFSNGGKFPFHEAHLRSMTLIVTRIVAKSIVLRTCYTFNNKVEKHYILVATSIWFGWEVSPTSRVATVLRIQKPEESHRNLKKKYEEEEKSIVSETDKAFWVSVDVKPKNTLFLSDKPESIYFMDSTLS